MALHNQVLETLRAGGTAGSIWLSLGSVAVAEIAAEAGPDCLVFDLQHGLWERQTLESAIGCTRSRAVPLVRVAANELRLINEALDAGALGVIVPLVETAEEARAAVAAAKYPPEGIRSGGGVRPLLDFKSYVPQANRAILVGVMIETQRGVENAAAIAAVPGIDLVFIGTGDLALSLGTFPEYGPRHDAAVLQVLDACKAAGTACGLYTPHCTFALDRRRQGFGLVNLGTDIDMIQGAAKAHVRRFTTGRPESGRPVDRVRGAVALVSGTNRGIGPETVRALLAGGAAKIYCGARRPEQLESLIAEAPDRLVPLALDITDPDSIAAAVAAAPDLTLLVNNAGINRNAGLLGPDALANARAEMETNYFGTFAMCRAFAPVLAANGGGTIVNMLTIVARVNLPTMSTYATTKAALLSLTQGLRAQLAAQGTHVMAVLPGATDTEMTRGFFDGYLMPPPEVAAALLFGLQTGAEEVYPGEMACGVSAGLATDAVEVERMFATFLPEAARQ